MKRSELNSDFVAAYEAGQDWALQKVLADLEVLQQGAGTVVLGIFPNPDGSPRWVWPITSKRPDFLHFYHTGSWKSRVFVWLCHFLFGMGMGKLLARKRIALTACALQSERWSLFTGTTGPNRKAVLRREQGGGEVVYVKYAIGSEASQSLQREHQALADLAQTRASSFFNVPKGFKQGEWGYGQYNIAGRHSRSPLFLDASIASALCKWMDAHCSPNVKAVQTVHYDTDRFPSSLVQTFEATQRWVIQNPLPVCVWQHGDFTPWNCRVEGEVLQVFDWEMLDKQGVPLGDLFHFVYQQAILVDRLDAAQLHQKIQQMLHLPPVQAFIDAHRLDPRALELHYLWHTASVYLPLYSKQHQWHLQVSWLLAIWEARMNLLLAHRGWNLRTQVLRDLDGVLKSLPHAWMKATVPYLWEVPETADIDLCAQKGIAGPLITFFKARSEVHAVRRKNLGKMDQLEVLLLDGSRIDLDLIYTFRRNAVQYLDAAAVLRDALPSEHGICYASAQHDAEYTARFYALNRAQVPEKHRHRLNGFANLQDAAKVRTEVANLPINRGIRAWGNRIAYFFELLRRMAQRDKAFVVTFSGVDGAGKSTILELVRQKLEKEHRRRVIVIRHRPSVLPILSAWKYGKKGAEEKSMAQLPRQGTNKSSLSSLFRFGYYLMDYLIGQWVVYFRHTLSGTIVLYDRYYFDFILDSRRSNIHLAPGFVSVFYRFVKKPAFNFFLWASPEEILKRKQELDSKTIVELTEAYTRLFEKLGSPGKLPVYRCIENREIQETMEVIFRLLGENYHETGIYPDRSTSQSPI